ncbi:Uncharacterized protein SVXHr_1342 [Halorhabdus sp. SVX81]|uniref:DUF5789 family protein n=1 Tax=Halorhabdus sp. SVX81 TaxID=2978283 RepID=UPI0023DB605D|nr:DUF5789 family protein [Halorhabdus sp. SVX81]WEL17511.1 Uncharacterized protein SVXHr_1342 [Halorhabdus sp. SVX81]
MADDTDEESEGPPIELGDGPDVAGVPLAQISSRLTYGIEQSTVRRREGDTEIRTPDGPRELGDILDAVDVPYFERRQEFETAIREEIGTGPVSTE